MVQKDNKFYLEYEAFVNARHENLDKFTEIILEENRMLQDLLALYSKTLPLGMLDHFREEKPENKYLQGIDEIRMKMKLFDYFAKQGSEKLIQLKNELKKITDEFINKYPHIQSEVTNG